AKSSSNDQDHNSKPITPNTEFAAVKFASIIAEFMDLNDDQIEEIQLAMIEFCVNANEHNKNPDKRVISQYIVRTDALEFSIKDLRR
ncbi:ATP-binding protein, partial [Candidatus Poribacteria bacterium]|nr:ATP-binding protein [Candidatus Poribacteria bacterium]